VTAASVSEPAATLHTKIVGGFAWSMVMVATLQGSRIIFGIGLARLLTPREYGLAGMALVFSSLVLTFSDFSMGAALVQRKQITEADRSTVFWTSTAVGVLLVAAGVALSGPLASFYNQPEVRPLFAVVSISFLLVALQTTQASLLQREMRFRVITMRVAAGNVIGGIAGITAAALGAGAWAIIASQLFTSATSTLLLWTFSSWRPKLVFSLRSLRELGGFGLNLFGARSLNYLNRNADNILVGRFLGSAPLGAYSVAYNIMLLPLGQLIIPIQDVLYPAYSHWQEDRDRLAAAWLRVVRMVAALVCPMMVGVAIVSDDFVRVVLGERWLVAAPVLRILAPVALLQSLSALGERLLTAVDRTRLIFRFTALECALTVPAFAVGLHWGILGVAACYAIVTTPLQVVYIVLTARALDTRLSTFARCFSGVVQATIGMGLAAYATKLAVSSLGIAPFERLALEIVVSALVYIALCRLRQPEVVDELRKIRRIHAARSEAGLMTS
jgi:O-antigen/teichoic acid export membrane protein